MKLDGKSVHCEAGVKFMLQFIAGTIVGIIATVAFIVLAAFSIWKRGS